MAKEFATVSIFNKSPMGWEPIFVCASFDNLKKKKFKYHKAFPASLKINKN